MILARCKIDNETWKDADIERLLIVDSLDYNDKAIAHLCALKGHVLVTNDKDFRDSDIDIISSHRGFFMTRNEEPQVTIEAEEEVTDTTVTTE